MSAGYELHVSSAPTPVPMQDAFAENTAEAAPTTPLATQ
jgi:hypothetical protein